VPPVLCTTEHAGLQHQRQHASARKRRLAAAAHADDQHESRTALGLPTELHQYAGDRGGASEEDRCVLGAERFEATER
jgi:hypothetical protein